MPAIAPLIINDGQATPAAHTFTPVFTDGSKSGWVERSAGVPSGFLTLTHEYRRPATVTAAHRMLMGLNVPVIATVNGSPSVVRYSSAQVTFNLSSASLEQERKDLYAYVGNILLNASMRGTVQYVEPFY